MIPTLQLGQFGRGRKPADKSDGYLSPFYPTTLYSMRLRNPSYSGPCVRVKRSSDSTQQDIGFGADGFIDESALRAFVGVGTGYVKTWYDQSGGGVDVTDAGNADAVILIKSGGATWTSGGRPALRFDQTVLSQLAVAANSAFAFGTGAWTWEAFFEPTSNNGASQGILDFRTVGIAVAQFYNQSGTLPTLYDGANNPSSGPGTVVFNVPGHQAVSYAGGSGGALKLFCYGAMTHSTTSTISFTGNRPLMIGANYAGTGTLTCMMQEVRITAGSVIYSGAFTPPVFIA